MTRPTLIDIAPIAPQLSKLIPLLASDQDGEVVATARAIGRVLTTKGLNWSDLAQSLSESKLPSSPTSGPRQPSAFEMVAWCRKHGHGRLSGRDHKFILTVAASLTLGGRLSVHQTRWLRDIYTRLHHGRAS